MLAILGLKASGLVSARATRSGLSYKQLSLEKFA